METVTISKKSLEIITRDLLEIWDFMELHDAQGRKVIAALDEAIEILGLQPELEEKAQIERERVAAEWRARQAAQNGEAN